MSSFIVKVLLPAALCSLATYLMLGYAKPHMLPRMRLFLSAIWIGIAIPMGAPGRRPGPITCITACGRPRRRSANPDF